MIQIEELEPRHSIVITPAKMSRFYDKFELKNELYPWSSILTVNGQMIMPLMSCYSCVRPTFVNLQDV